MQTDWHLNRKRRLPGNVFHDKGKLRRLQALRDRRVHVHKGFGLVLNLKVRTGQALRELVQIGVQRPIDGRKLARRNSVALLDRAHVLVRHGLGLAIHKRDGLALFFSQVNKQVIQDKPIKSIHLHNARPPLDLHVHHHEGKGWKNVHVLGKHVGFCLLAGTSGKLVPPQREADTHARAQLPRKLGILLPLVLVLGLPRHNGPGEALDLLEAFANFLVLADNGQLLRVLAYDILASLFPAMSISSPTKHMHSMQRIVPAPR